MAKVKSDCMLVLNRESVRQLMNDMVIDGYVFDNLEVTYVIANDVDDDKFLTLYVKPKPKIAATLKKPEGETK